MTTKFPFMQTKKVLYSLRNTVNGSCGLGVRVWLHVDMLLLTIMASNETNAIWEILKPIDFGKNWRAFVLLVCFSWLSVNFTFIPI